MDDFVKRLKQKTIDYGLATSPIKGRRQPIPRGQPHRDKKNDFKRRPKHRKNYRSF